MITFVRIELHPISVYDLKVLWILEPTAEDLTSYEFKVSRSYTPSGPWTIRMDWTAGVSSFTDDEVDLHHDNRKYYYKVYAKLGSKQISETFTYESNYPDKVGLALANKMKLVLRVKTGKLCTLYIKLTEGARCHRCWDPLRKLVTKANCEYCKGTGFVGGYVLFPENVYLNFNMNPELLKRTPWGEIPNNEGTAQASNYPLYSPGDVVIEPDNGLGKKRRWIIDKIHPIENHRWIVHQLLKLKRLPYGSPEEVFPDMDV